MTNDTILADDYLFYHFVSRGDVAVNHWSDYIVHPTTSNDSVQFHPEMALLNTKNLTSNDIDAASSVWPLDIHNIALLDHVHPTGWKNPDPQNQYDLVVIGAGAAGLITSSGAAGVGARVALIEANLLGGDCLNVGCVPSKTLIRAAQLAHTVKNSEALAATGISITGKVDIDFSKIMERIRKIRAQISQHDSAVRYSKELGVDVFIGR